jgi:hypothetical protein
MKKLILGIAILGSLGLAVACGGDDEESTPPGGTGGTMTGTGGTTVGTGGTTVGTGGTTVGTGGTTTGTGGTTGGGAELLDAEAKTNGWIGGDPTSADDNPSGVQGALYQYGDDITCKAAEGNPCTADGCCIDYTTITDATFKSWGCGVGLALNATDTGTKSAYAGTATGFNVTYSNTGTAKVRIGYTQAADTAGQVSPFVDGVTGANAVPFSGVTCPTWPGSTCIPPTSAPFDLQVQVVGGEAEGTGKLCITSITAL